MYNVAKGLIPCQITQWVKPYPLQIYSNLGFRVIMAQQAQISAPSDKQFSRYGMLFLIDFGQNAPDLQYSNDHESVTIGCN